MTTQTIPAAAENEPEVVILKAASWTATRKGEFFVSSGEKRKLATWRVTGPCPKCQRSVVYECLRNRWEVKKLTPVVCVDCVEVKR